MRELVFRDGTEADKQRLLRQLKGTYVHFWFENDYSFVLQDGDLSIDKDFNNDGILVVDGNFTVQGLYDDYNPGPGVIVVLGDMRARNVYSWGSVFVQGDLTATELILTVYNDFDFEVRGKVNARGLVVSNKNAAYKFGQVGCWMDRSKWSGGQRPIYDAAYQAFLPELFTHPEHLDREILFDFEYWTLRFDDAMGRERLRSGGELFRDQPATVALDPLIAELAEPDTSDARLLELIEIDPLLAQLISARPSISETVVTKLRGIDDPIIAAWLA